MIKLIASDLDGTLCNENHCLDIRTVQYIKKLRQKGIWFVIASGRSFEVIEPLIKKYGLECPVISLNGALILDEKGKMLKEGWMREESVRKLLQMTKEKQLLTVMYTEEGNYCSDASLYYKKMEKLVRQMPDYHLFMEEHGMISFVDLNPDSPGRVYKVEIYAGYQEIHDEVSNIADIHIYHYENDVLEINDYSVSKASGVEFFCEQQCLKNEEVMAFGDSENDMEMLQKYRYGHIMRNAKESLLAKVNHIAPSNLAYGVPRVIENYTGILFEKISDE